LETKKISSKKKGAAEKNFKKKILESKKIQEIFLSLKKYSFEKIKGIQKNVEKNLQKRNWICTSRRPIAGAGGERRPCRASGRRTRRASRFRPPVPPPAAGPAAPPAAGPAAPPASRRPARGGAARAPPSAPPTGGGVAEIGRRRAEICRRRGARSTRSAGGGRWRRGPEIRSEERGSSEICSEGGEGNGK